MGNFQSYSKYYDLLYKDKNYAAEAKYVASLVKKYAPNSKTMLELGCGSGNHAHYLVQDGFEITGVERSIEMVEEAKKKQIDNFFPIQAEIENFSFNKREFDVAISLFHVISYITDNQLLVNSLRNINQHLKSGGFFIFDVWYSPAIYHQKPETRIKRLANDEFEITRLAEPIIKSEKNTINVNYEILITDKQTLKIDVLRETHPMRHFSIPEVGFLALLSGFEIAHTEEFLTAEQPSENTWGVCFVLKKV